MGCYLIYLEIGVEGECLAHVLDLPGCVLRGGSLPEVLDGMPDRIRGYLEWLRKHGEEIAEVESFKLRVAETSQGFGPFRRGDRAALFPPDLLPLTPDEMEMIYYRRATYARKDLMGLVDGLSQQMLNWRKNEGEMTIAEILRHIGNAEQWYVSRLVPAQTLPQEWDRDEGMDIYKFLEMERATAFERLRQLSNSELSAITRPTHWTRYPEEPWTARKAMRRLVEHELEHISHIQRLLYDYRQKY